MFENVKTNWLNQNKQIPFKNLPIPPVKHNYMFINDAYKTRKNRIYEGLNYVYDTDGEYYKSKSETFYKSDHFLCKIPHFYEKVY